MGLKLLVELHFTTSDFCQILTAFTKQDTILLEIRKGYNMLKIRNLRFLNWFLNKGKICKKNSERTLIDLSNREKQK